MPESTVKFDHVARAAIAAQWSFLSYEDCNVFNIVRNKAGTERIQENDAMVENIKTSRKAFALLSDPGLIERVEARREVWNTERQIGRNFDRFYPKNLSAEYAKLIVDLSLRYKDKAVLDAALAVTDKYERGNRRFLSIVISKLNNKMLSSDTSREDFINMCNAVSTDVVVNTVVDRTSRDGVEIGSRLFHLASGYLDANGEVITAMSKALDAHAEEDRDIISNGMKPYFNDLNREGYIRFCNLMERKEIVTTLSLYDKGYERECLFNNLAFDFIFNKDERRVLKAAEIMRDPEIMTISTKFREDMGRILGHGDAIGSACVHWFSKAAVRLQDMGIVKEYAKTVDAQDPNFAGTVQWMLGDYGLEGSSETFKGACELFQSKEFKETITRNAMIGVDQEKTQKFVIARLVQTVREVRADKELALAALDLFQKYADAHGPDSAAEFLYNAIVKAPVEILKDRKKLSAMMEDLNVLISSDDVGLGKIEALHTRMLLKNLGRNAAAPQSIRTLTDKQLACLSEHVLLKSDFERGDGERAIRATVPLPTAKLKDVAEYMQEEIDKIAKRDKNTAYAVASHAERDEKLTKVMSEDYYVLTISNLHTYCYDSEFKKIDAAIKRIYYHILETYAPEILPENAGEVKKAAVEPEVPKAAATPTIESFGGEISMIALDFVNLKIERDVKGNVARISLHDRDTDERLTSFTAIAKGRYAAVEVDGLNSFKELQQYDGELLPKTVEDTVKGIRVTIEPERDRRGELAMPRNIVLADELDKEIVSFHPSMTDKIPGLSLGVSLDYYDDLKVVFSGNLRRDSR